MMSYDDYRRINQYTSRFYTNVFVGEPLTASTDEFVISQNGLPEFEDVCRMNDFGSMQCPKWARSMNFRLGNGEDGRGKGMFLA